MSKQSADLEAPFKSLGKRKLQALKLPSRGEIRAALQRSRELFKKAASAPRARFWRRALRAIE